MTVAQADVEAWRGWIGRSETRRQVLDPEIARRYAAAVGSDLDVTRVFPAARHWAYFVDVAGPSGPRTRRSPKARRRWPDAADHPAAPHVRRRSPGVRRTPRARSGRRTHPHHRRCSPPVGPLRRSGLRRGRSHPEPERPHPHPRSARPSSTATPASRRRPSSPPPTRRWVRRPGPPPPSTCSVTPPATFNSHRIHYDRPLCGGSRGLSGAGRARPVHGGEAVRLCRTRPWNGHRALRIPSPPRQCSRRSPRTFDPTRRRRPLRRCVATGRNRYVWDVSAGLRAPHERCPRRRDRGNLGGLRRLRPDAASIDGDWDGALTVPAGIKGPAYPAYPRRGGDHRQSRPKRQGCPDRRAARRQWGHDPAAEVRRGVRRRVSPDGKTMSGPFRQGGVTMQASFTLRAAGAAAAAPDRPQTPHPPFPYVSRDVTFTGGNGVMLAGTLTQPNGTGPFPAVVMIAGSGTAEPRRDGGWPQAVLGDRRPAHARRRRRAAL